PRPDALDVPRVKELVRDGAQQARAVRTDRTRRGDDGAVAVLHAVAVVPRQVVGDERVGAGFVRRELAVDAAFLAHDLLDIARVAVELRVVSVLMDRKPERRFARAVADGER